MIWTIAAHRRNASASVLVGGHRNCPLPSARPVRIVLDVLGTHLLARDFDAHSRLMHEQHPTIVHSSADSAAPKPKPTITIRATWVGEHRFLTSRPDGPTALFDGSARAAQNPVDALVSALASCVAIDVVDILAKRRTPVSRLVVDAHAERRATFPRRLERVTLTFHVEGEGIEVGHTERGVALALEKYCSVSASLAPDIVMETVVVANGVSGSPALHGATGGAT
jgi:putative redox protein